jgi:DNA-binding NarL/FixJ family response regulator
MTTQQRPRLVNGTLAAMAEVGPAPYGLSEQELEVLYLLRNGLYIPQICDVLALPVRVVEGYVDSILEKMNALSKTEAAVRAIREGIFGRA